MVRTLVCASLVLASLAPLALSQVPAHAAWYNPNYLYKKSVTIDHTKVVANNPAPAVTFMESGTDATQDQGFYDQKWCATDNTVAHTGSRSLGCGLGLFNIKNGVVADAGSRISFYLYIQSFPTANDAVTEIDTGGNATIYRLCLATATHKLFSAKAGCTAVTTGTTVLATSTWYHISLSYAITSTNVNAFRVFLNGTPEFSDTNIAGLTTASNELQLGRETGAGGAATFNYDDVYVDNGSDLSDPGDIRVTAKRPNANGAANGFTTQIGAGGSGYGTGHSPQVNEQPLSVTNGWSWNVASTRENYAIEGAATGDVDVSAKAVVADEAWIWAKTAAGCAGLITNNGTDTAITLTTSAAVYTNAVNIHSYPSNAATVGMQSCASATLISLYEAGMLIAYLGSGDTLTNFPVLVKETSDANLKTVGNGGLVQNASGFDMIFTDSTETTKLDHEIENYVPTTGEIEMWVRIPSLSAAVDTVIYLYYDNSSISTSQENKTGVWDANYKAVWHLRETSGNQNDSTSNGNNLTTINVTTQGSATGQIGGADGLTTTSNFLEAPGLMGSPANVTISGWGSLVTAGSNGSSVIAIGDYAEIQLDAAGVTQGSFYNGASWHGPTFVATYAGTGWHYFVFTEDSTNTHQALYVDGIMKAQASFVGAPSYSGQGSNTFLGTHGNGNANWHFIGTLDESRVSASVRSAGWIATEYNDQSSPSTFLTFGAAVAGAVSGTQTFTVSINPGVLTVVAPAPFTLPNLTPGTIAPTATLGALGYTDTLNDATAWGVTLAATDLGAGQVPFTRFTIGVTTAGNITAVPGAIGMPTAGAASQTLAGADGTPGTTFSTAITLASAAAAVEGSYSTPAGATGNTITIVVPGTTPAGGPFTSTLQYTITG